MIRHATQFLKKCNRTFLYFYVFFLKKCPFFPSLNKLRKKNPPHRSGDSDTISISTSLNLNFPAYFQIGRLISILFPSVTDGAACRARCLDNPRLMCVNACLCRLSAAWPQPGCAVTSRYRVLVAEGGEECGTTILHIVSTPPLPPS